MEQNTETKTLSFSKGMTNIPSDLLSEDSELAYSVDFIYRNGEMVPVQSMQGIGTINGKIMHVHKMADYENIIAYDKFVDEGTITWYDRKDISEKAKQTFKNIGEVSDIKSIGNTLVVATSKSIRYFLFKGGVYKNLGTELPIPQFVPFLEKKTSGLNSYKCELSQIITGTANHAWYDSDGNFIGYFNGSPNQEEGDRYTQGEYCRLHTIIKDRETDYLNAVQGCVTKAIEREKENNVFMFPFFIRYALKLYDGTYTRISAPIICYPTISRNCEFYNSTANGSTNDFFFVPRSSVLKYMASITDFENWKDVVKEMTIFASDEVKPYYSLDSKYTSDWRMYAGPIEQIPAGFSAVCFNDIDETIEYSDMMSQEKILPRYKSDGEIIEELLGKSQFFKLASLKLDKTDIGSTLSEPKVLPLKRNVVSTLTSQEQLKNDDYYGWAHLYAKKMFPYNNRINVFDLERLPFKGFNNFLATNGNDNADIKITYYVHIVSSTMDSWVKSDDSTFFKENTLSGWLFYPDPNATEMIIHIHGTDTDKKLRISLNAHNMLNGAYSFENLPTEAQANTTEEAEDITLPVIDEDAHETLDSQVFTSVVSNPFVFEASGDNTIGTGRVLGIVANTEAVSQGQFGQYPLLIFTDEGIYAMSVNSEGLYSSIHPISREICNNADSITPTDKVVFFTSSKGLMATSGGEAACVSEVLSGKKSRRFPEIFMPFKKFLENALIAYDYNASMLRIFNKNTNYHYVYNMIDKNFGIANNHTGGKVYCRNVANNYPDNLVQFTDSTVYSLTEIPEPEDDETLYTGVICTRPLKLGGSMMLKSLRAIRNLRDTDSGKLSLKIYASNNAKNWCQLTSLLGKPWAYFTFEYTLTDFKASDSFQGSVVVIQNRRSLLRGQN